MNTDELNTLLDDLDKAVRGIAISYEIGASLWAVNLQMSAARRAIVAHSARKDAEIRKLRSMLATYKHAFEHRPARPLPRRNCVRRRQGGA
jgi:hypothetical protein